MSERAGRQWVVKLHRPERPAEVVASFDAERGEATLVRARLEDLETEVEAKRTGTLTTFHCTATTWGANAKCHFSLDYVGEAESVWSFVGQATGRTVFRQSPHDPARHDLSGLTMQPVPMVAVRTPAGFWVAISDSPAKCGNATAQVVDPATGEASIASGDSGEVAPPTPERAPVAPRFHTVDPLLGHSFSGVVYRTDATDLLSLRRSVFATIASQWGESSDRFGATAFATNYMHYRVNETGKSRFWICPGIEYANKQYTRDAFWQALVLPPEMAQECYNNEAAARSVGAERPLITLIWTHRIHERGGRADPAAAKWALSYIEGHTNDGFYRSTVKPTRKDFQSWYDLCAFDDDDAITYNQGLLCVAVRCAVKLGLSTSLSPAQVDDAYRSMFDERGGYYPLSRKKNLLCVDALVGDLLSQLLCGEPVLPSEHVRRHHATLNERARTPHGYKVTCAPDGEYAEPGAYSVEGFRSKIEDAVAGEYQYGGSWYLYDMLCLIDCHLHGAEGATDDAVWRARIDFERGGTYHECTNTVTGELRKPNQGWNGAAWAIWRDLVAAGKADDRMFKEIDGLA